MQTVILLSFLSTSAGARAAQGGIFPRGRGSILLDDMECTGTEANLLDCSGETEEHDCSHQEDAGVVCEGWSNSYSQLYIYN